jgi:hypothetical protein
LDTVDAPPAAVVVACTKGPDVVDAVAKGTVVLAVAAPVVDAPKVPVQVTPCGQQPTTLLRSAEQMAVRGQQRPTALLHW